jgi:hypothetical protein
MRIRLCLAVAIAGVLVLSQAAGAQAPTQDSATGSGSTPTFYSAFSFSATSDPLGGSPSGSASWNQFGFHFEGTVTCLAVDGNQAIIGIDVDAAASSSSAFEGFLLTAIDDGPAGSGLDTFDAIPTSFTSLGNTVPTTCVFAFRGFTPDQLVSGDIVVTDAPPLPTSMEQCKNGGWQTYGIFKNQGDCVSFVATGGKNPPGKTSG